MNKTRTTALICTVVLLALILLLLLTLYLRYSGEEKRVWPPENTSELLMEGEYVKLGDVPEPRVEKPTPAPAASQPEPKQETEDLHDAGKPADMAPATVTSTKESPMKVAKKPKPEKPGPTKEELEAEAKAKREAETAKKISSRVNFGGQKNGKAAEGSAGSPNGNATTGALAGSPGFSLRGRSLESWSSPSGTTTGTIIIRVRVNREGHVTSASYQGGSGAISSDANARRSCEQAATRSKFSVSQDAPAEQVGTITYRFK